MRGALMIAMAGCGGPRVAAPAVAPAVAPAGWVAIAAPDEARRRCANYAEDEWQVSIDRGAVVAVEAQQREADTGPPLPFTPDVKFEAPPRKHVLAVDDGFLVGFDAGEWGGALYWFSADGARALKLGDTNVRGLAATGGGRVAAIEGLAHLTMSDGNVRWIQHAPPGAWRAVALSTLDGAPRTFAATADALYLLTTESLERLGPDRKAVSIQRVDTASLYPDSMAIDGAGALWIGMRRFILRMRPIADHQFAETWFVRASCAHATVHDLTCVCDH